MLKKRTFRVKRIRQAGGNNFQYFFSFSLGYKEKPKYKKKFFLLTINKLCCMGNTLGVGSRKKFSFVIINMAYFNVLTHSSWTKIEIVVHRYRGLKSCCSFGTFFRNFCRFCSFGRAHFFFLAEINSGSDKTYTQRRRIDT